MPLCTRARSEARRKGFAWNRYLESAVSSSKRAIPRHSPPGIANTCAFPADTSYFGPGPAPFMVNYRVRNLDTMLAQLRTAGVRVEDRVEDYDYGRFGWATDPEGNRFELWEPRSPGHG